MGMGVVLAFLAGYLLFTIGVVYLSAIGTDGTDEMPKRADVEAWVKRADGAAHRPEVQYEYLCAALSNMFIGAEMPDDVAARLTLGIADRLRVLCKEGKRTAPDIRHYVYLLQGEEKMTEVFIRCVEVGVVGMGGEEEDDVLQGVMRRLEAEPRGEGAEGLIQSVIVALEHGLKPCRLMNRKEGRDILSIAIRTHSENFVRALAGSGVHVRDAHHARALQELAAAEGCEGIQALFGEENSERKP